MEWHSRIGKRDQTDQLVFKKKRKAKGGQDGRSAGHAMSQPVHLKMVTRPEKATAGAVALGQHLVTDWRKASPGHMLGKMTRRCCTNGKCIKSHHGSSAWLDRGIKEMELTSGQSTWMLRTDLRGLLISLLISLVQTSAPFLFLLLYSFTPLLFLLPFLVSFSTLLIPFEFRILVILHN